ncbi:MAG: SPOR domain-containing protein [Pseudomonadota bacterium]
MARDYKPRGTKQRKATAGRKRGGAGASKKGRRGGSGKSAHRRDSAPGWQWLLSGLGAGLLVAAGVFIIDRLPGGVIYERGGQPAPAPAASSADAGAEPSSPVPRSNPTPPDRDSQAPREYAFYDLLPRFEVVIPEARESAVDTPIEGATAVREPGTYILQAGSFRQHDDADRMQATLALQGIESRIQIVTIDDVSYHRVRVGPIADLVRLEQLRDQLRTIDVDHLIIRVANEE